MNGSPTPRSSNLVLRGNFVLLRADGLQLLLPQQDVSAAEYLEDSPRESTQRGLFELDGATEGGGKRCVAALSAKMSLLPHYPEGRFLLTAFESQGGMLMCWNEVKVLIDAELEPRQLPLAMLHDDAPLREYVEFGDELAFCCTAKQLLVHALAHGS